jgi:hypothetical protein
MKRERLTKKRKLYGNYTHEDCFIHKDGGCYPEIADCRACELLNAYKRLAEYEDAEEQGLLVRLPCKVGKVVYRINKGKVAKFKVTAFKLDGVRLAMTLVDYERMWKYCDRSASTFGKTTFLTRQEAERALEEI